MENGSEECFPAVASKKKGKITIEQEKLVAFSCFFVFRVSWKNGLPYMACSICGQANPFVFPGGQVLKKEDKKSIIEKMR